MRDLMLLCCLAVGSLAPASSAQFTLLGQEVEITLTMPGFVPPTWLPAIYGSAEVRDHTVDQSSDVRDAADTVGRMLDALDFIFMGQAEFRVGDWLLRGGLLTTDLSGSRDFFGGQIQIDGEFGLDYLTGEIGYRLGDLRLADVSEPLPALTLTTDVFVGVRYTKLEGNLAFRRGPGLGGSTDWADLSLGTRVHIAPDTGSPLSATLEGHIAAGSSDFVWDAKGLLNYALGEHFVVSGGWKFLSVDYTDTSLPGGDFGLDLILGGPVLELSTKF